MKKVLFFDLIHPNNGEIYNLSEIKSLALKQISRGRFEMVDEEIILKLEEGNIIYDTKGLCGLWAMPKEMLLKCFNEQCLERYGSSFLILKPVADCYYLNDKEEIIGDRFEVIDKINFKQYEIIKEEVRMKKYN